MKGYAFIMRRRRVQVLANSIYPVRMHQSCTKDLTKHRPHGAKLNAPLHQVQFTRRLSPPACHLSLYTCHQLQIISINRESNYLLLSVHTKWYMYMTLSSR